MRPLSLWFSWLTLAVFTAFFVIKGNREFKQLYQRHKELDKKVLDAELGVLPIDDTTLSQMKREKLAAKDRLTRLYDTLQH